MDLIYASTETNTTPISTTTTTKITTAPTPSPSTPPTERPTTHQPVGGSTQVPPQCTTFGFTSSTCGANGKLKYNSVSSYCYCECKQGWKGGYCTGIGQNPSYQYFSAVLHFSYLCKRFTAHCWRELCVTHDKKPLISNTNLMGSTQTDGDRIVVVRNKSNQIKIKESKRNIIFLFKQFLKEAFSLLAKNFKGTFL